MPSIPLIILRILTLSAVLAVLSWSEFAHAQPLNLNFERVSTEGPTRPWNWTPFAYAPGAEVRVDDAVSREGRRSFRISRPDQSPAAGTPHAFATYLRPMAALRKPARVTGWIKTQNLDGRAYLTIQTWADFQVLAADTTNGGSESADWTQYEMELSVAPETETLVITANLEGTGTAWFDDLTLEIDGMEAAELPIARDVKARDIDWLVRHSSPLRTVDATPEGSIPDLLDLDAVGAIVGDARVVALGESTHGTSEFFRLKHRIFEYLVREHDFRLFAIEDQQLG